MADASPNRSNRGVLVVIAMIVLGLIAGAIALTYWKKVDERSFAKQPPAPGSGKAATGSREAEEEHARVSTLLNDITDEARQLPGVIEEARRLTERFPDSAKAHLIYSQTLTRAKRLDEAYTASRRSLELAPRDPAVQFFAGMLATARKQFEEARKHFSSAVDLEPRHANYRVHLAATHTQLGDFDRARSLLLEAINLDSSSYEAYFALSDVYFQQHKLGLALDQIDRAIKEVPISQRPVLVDYTRRKALIQRNNNQPEEALRTLKALKRDEQETPAVMADIARCHAQLGEPAEAAKVYEGAFKRNPTEWEYAAEAAQWWIRAGDAEAAKRNIAQVRALSPRQPKIAELEEQLQKIEGK
jgi:tetratricopeptide (TPR) repeat protein